MRKLLPALILVSAGGAHAYNEAIHGLITRRALESRPDMGEALQPPTPADLDAFRALFWRTASADAAFAGQYPSAAAFGAWEFKEFFMLDPAARVHGFDPTPEEAKPLPRADLLALASRWPDDDERNRHRYLRDAKTRQIVAAPDGSPLPYDPATLDFGGLGGISSQGHAHYGLIDGPLSDDPEVLKKDPRRFAVPPTAHAVGAEFSQLYTDLALLAASSGLPSAQWLTATFAGAAFHHLEDVCNQIHTVQVGIYEFFESAFWQSKLRDLKTLGGLLGERRSLKQIGLRLIANHHLLSEDLFARRSALGQPLANDARTEQRALDKIALAGGWMGLGLAKALIEESSFEAPQIYRLSWAFSARTLHDGVSGHEYDGSKGDDPEAYLESSAAAEQAVSDFFGLENRGLVRAATALRLWQRLFDAEHENAAPDLLRRRAAERELQILLPYHAQAAQRRAAYQPASPQGAGIAWGYPAAAAALLAGAAALVWSRRSKRW
jgi:hypothetical protein